MNRVHLPIGDCAYTAAAVYYGDADTVEYVRRDEPSVYRKIDGLLTLVLSMTTREPIGFQLKGFRHFYLQHVKDKIQRSDDTFLELITILEEAVRGLGNEVFSEEERLSAYVSARDIAKEDEVKLSELSIVA